MQDTHFYDGKMSVLIDVIKDELLEASNIEKKSKEEAFCELYNLLTTYTSFSKISAAYLMQLIMWHRAYGRTKLGNPLFDPLNGLHGCDLLWLLYKEIVEKKSTDHGELFCIMLEDMHTGVCPQGICVRCFQILIMMKEKL